LFAEIVPSVADPVPMSIYSVVSEFIPEAISS